MPPTVLCVPNVSEGRDQAIIKQITSTVLASPGAALLDVDSGEDTNRTVITFAGTPEAVADAAWGVIGMACELIDMTGHKGTHPRFGAADVVPFVPIADVTVEQCVELAQALGQRAAEEFTLPVYLYGYAATRPERAKLSNIRAGEYEGLVEKLNDPAFAPDFGPTKLNAKSGATLIGVRDFLLAYNVNLETTDVAIARQIAGTVRQPDTLAACQARGWAVEAYGCAQVTMNLPNYTATGLHDAFEAVRAEAEGLGVGVSGSELIGLAPKQALVDAGTFYLDRAGQSPTDDSAAIAAASEHLGLADKGPLDAEQKIVEYRVAELLSS